MTPILPSVTKALERQQQQQQASATEEETVDQPENLMETIASLKVQRMQQKLHHIARDLKKDAKKALAFHKQRMLKRLRATRTQHAFVDFVSNNLIV